MTSNSIAINYMRSGNHATFSKPNNLSPKTSLLHPRSRLSFTAHLSKSHFPPKTRCKSIRTTTTTTPVIKASVCDDSIYVSSPQSFYDLLGVSETGTLSEIKKAYKQLARKYHPDVSPPGRTGEYTKMFIQVQEAYETLSDPERRALYDRDMSRVSGLGQYTIFSAGKRYRRNVYHHQEDTFEWEQRWQSQLAELIRRSNSRNSSSDLGDLSWGARMRKQKSCSS